MKIAQPIIEVINNSSKQLEDFKISLELQNNEKKDLIKNFPTVYIHNWSRNNKFEVYIGESNDFFKRTSQHYDEIEKPNSWQKNLKNTNSSLYVIAHEEFNKSLTLDIENKLIHYLSSCSSVEKVHNARGNPQNKYFPCENFDAIFSNIWKKLRQYNNALFLSENEIKDSAIYKASPLHKLNFEQNLAKEKILDKIDECLLKEDNSQLIFVQGNAGTGKTVLLSSMFYDLLNRKKHDVDSDNIDVNNLETAIVVNHDEQLIVYREIVKKLDLMKNNQVNAFKSTVFINMFLDKTQSSKSRKKKYDVVFVDEAHLLLTQKNQAYTKDNDQLTEILKYAKVVVVMFDKNQIMNTEQYLLPEKLDCYIEIAKNNNCYIKLKEQMRMKINKDLQLWIRNFIDNGIIDKCPRNRGKYEITSFDSPKELEIAIKSKANNELTSLSRIIATYDWNYSSASAPSDEKYWNVKIGNWKKPWNRELIRYDSKLRKVNSNLAWAEQQSTIDEVGSIFTIQGFDLNYAGVILGPSIKYRNGKIIFDKNSSCNRKAIQQRNFSDGSSKCFSDELLKNELNVLLTRGVNGLYIYACDDELREHLNESINL